MKNGINPDPNTIHPVAGNPARVIRKRFDDELISLMLKFKWWDKPINEIDSLIPVLTSNRLDEVKDKIKEMLGIVE